MPVKEASSEETPYGRYMTSEGWFVLNLSDALAVRNEEKGGAEFRSSRGRRGSATSASTSASSGRASRARCTTPEGVQEGFLVLSGECTLIVEEEERPLRQWDYFHARRNPPCHRRRRRRPVRDPHDRCAAGCEDPLSGERSGGEVRCVRREGDR